jgi:hypothetical protein
MVQAADDAHSCEVCTSCRQPCLLCWVSLMVEAYQHPVLPFESCLMLFMHKLHPLKVSDLHASAPSTKLKLLHVLVLVCSVTPLTCLAPAQTTTTGATECLQQGEQGGGGTPRWGWR